ncbi:hypothetical protein ACHWQZ_G003121 [Mnemiopsis leidyi]
MINALSHVSAMKSRYGSSSNHRPEELLGHHHKNKHHVGLEKIRRVTVAIAEEGKAQAAMVRKQMMIARGNEKRYNRHRRQTMKYDVIGYDGGHDIRVPRDAQTEKRCQMFSVIVTLLSLLAIFFFAMTKPVWTTTIPPDYYKSLCAVEDVIPLQGTAQCNSVRSPKNTRVHCVISCNNGVNEDAVDKNFVFNADGRSFNLTCDKGKNAWTYKVDSICK